MESVQNIFSLFLSRLTSLPQLWTADRPAFWQTVAALAILLALLIIIILAIVKGGGRNKKTAPPESATTFVPVEEPDESIQGAMLSEEERIISSSGGLDEIARQRLVDEAPFSLATIVRVYDRCPDPVRQDLRGLVTEEKMLEGYALHLKEGYAQGVLIDAWRKFPDDKALQSWVELLGSKDEEQQRSAVRLLCALGEPKMLPLLVLALVRPETFLPARVAEVFLSMPREATTLLTYILPELEDEHKRAALEIISQTGVSFDAKNVLDCLGDPDLRIRSAAILALGSGHVTAALPKLLAAANDGDWQVRAAAAKALGMLGDSRALPMLEALTHDKEGWVAENARQARDGFYR